MEEFKKYLSLALLLAVAIVIYFVEPGGVWAALLTQLIAVAIIGAGGKKMSKIVVSLAVLIVSGIVAYLQVDGAFPVFPSYAGDLGLFLAALGAYAEQFVAFATPIVGAAMLTYNLILENVLKLIGGSIGLRLEPK